MAMFSVVVPIYNVERYLCQCIDSLVCQTYAEKEIILVDDGSTDSSGILCDEYVRQYDCVRVVHQANQGVSVARNRGLAIARGEWVAFVDADDWVETNMLERLMGFILAIPAELYRFGKFTKHTVVSFRSEQEKFRFYSQKHNLNKDVIQTVWGGVYRRDIIQENALAFVNRDEVVFEDTLFNYHYFLHTRKIAFLPEMPYHYRRHAASYCATRDVDAGILCCATLGEYAYRAVVAQGLPYFQEHFHHHYFLFLNTIVHTMASRFNDEHLRQLLDHLWQNPLHRKCLEKIRRESDLFIDDTRERVWYDERFGVEK